MNTNTRVVVTEEVFNKAKHLLNTGLFSRKQISEMLDLNKSSLSHIAMYGSLEEMRAAQRAAAKLAAQRRKEKAQREEEAKKAFLEALNAPDEEPEEPKRAPIGDCPNTVPEDSIELKADIIIEKLNTLIDLLKEVRIAQTSTSAGNNHMTTSTFYGSNKPF